jgi:tetratricopeptide (TPR) repeat protein
MLSIEKVNTRTGLRLSTCSKFQGQIRADRSTGDNEKASMTLVTLLNLDNKNSWALAEQGWIAYQKRDFEQAINLMEQAVNLNPESACYHYRLVCFLPSVKHDFSFSNYLALIAG